MSAAGGGRRRRRRGRQGRERQEPDERCPGRGRSRPPREAPASRKRPSPCSTRATSARWTSGAGASAPSPRRARARPAEAPSPARAAGRAAGARATTPKPWAERARRAGDVSGLDHARGGCAAAPRRARGGARATRHPCRARPSVTSCDARREVEDREGHGAQGTLRSAHRPRPGGPATWRPSTSSSTSTAPGRRDRAPSRRRRRASWRQVQRHDAEAEGAAGPSARKGRGAYADARSSELPGPPRRGRPGRPRPEVSSRIVPPLVRVRRRAAAAATAAAGRGVRPLRGLRRGGAGLPAGASARPGRPRGRRLPRRPARGRTTGVSRQRLRARASALAARANS